MYVENKYRYIVMIIYREIVFFFNGRVLFFKIFLAFVFLFIKFSLVIIFIVRNFVIKIIIVIYIFNYIIKVRLKRFMRSIFLFDNKF